MWGDEPGVFLPEASKVSETAQVAPLRSGTVLPSGIPHVYPPLRQFGLDLSA